MLGLKKDKLFLFEFKKKVLKFSKLLKLDKKRINYGNAINSTANVLYLQV